VVKATREMRIEFCGHPEKKENVISRKHII
jgi:hypothetical protein